MLKVALVMAAAAGTLVVPAAAAQAQSGYCRIPDAAPGKIGKVTSQGRSYAGFPSVSAAGGKLFATYARNIDTVNHKPSGLLVSTNGGSSWRSAGTTPMHEAPIQLRDGRLFGTEYYFSAAGTHANELDVLTSKNGGRTWTSRTARFSTPDPLVGGGVAHGQPVQLPNGTILQTTYVRYKGESGHRAEVFASTDGGRSFKRWGVLARARGGYVHNEAAIARVRDGSLLAVLRRDGGKYATLHYTRSTDGGRHWTSVRPLRPAGQYCQARGVSPRLLLMPSGTLVLSSGRPDNWLAVSTDGLGRSWREQQVTYHNRDGVSAAHGPSGYTGIAAVGRNTLIQLFDNCKLPGKNDSACPRGGDFEHGSGYGIKSRRITIP